RVDARPAEIQEALCRELMRRVHDSRVDHHVVVDELRGPRRVRENATDGTGDEVDVLRSIRLEPVIHGGLVAEIDLVARGSQDVAKAAGGQAANDGRANETGVASDVDAGGGRRECHAILLIYRLSAWSGQFLSFGPPGPGP